MHMPASDTLPYNSGGAKAVAWMSYFVLWGARKHSQHQGCSRDFAQTSLYREAGNSHTECNHAGHLQALDLTPLMMGIPRERHLQHCTLKGAFMWCQTILWCAKDELMKSRLLKMAAPCQKQPQHRPSAGCCSCQQSAHSGT